MNIKKKKLRLFSVKKTNLNNGNPNYGNVTSILSLKFCESLKMQGRFQESREIQVIRMESMLPYIYLKDNIRIYTFFLQHPSCLQKCCGCDLLSICVEGGQMHLPEKKVCTSPVSVAFPALKYTHLSPQTSITSYHVCFLSHTLVNSDNSLVCLLFPKE